MKIVRRSAAKIALSLLIALLSSMFLPQLLSSTPILAATPISVTTTVDELDVDGNCSLREAIYAANLDTSVDACPAGSGADTIMVPSGIYVLSIVDAFDDNMGSVGTDLDVRADLTIVGAGASSTIIDGNALDWVFEVEGVTAELSNLTVRNGVSGIFNNYGDVTLKNSIVSGHTLSGIYNAAGGDHLVVINSLITNNSSDWGGGIAGGVKLIDSTVSGNTAGAGGGIAGDSTIINSVISGNTASAGGGLYRGGKVINSTISDNVADYGGGIYTESAPIELINATISGNTAHVRGGGLFSEVGAQRAFVLKNTIIAKNTGGNAPDCFVPSDDAPASQGYNLLGDNTGCPIVGSVDDLIGTSTNSIDPLLAPLADNGGPTKTRALLPGSPAIDAGDPNAGLTDQRGVPRDVHPDIGAFEYVPGYTFSGFRQPVDNPPILNVVSAGRAIPVKFSLGGNQGLSIFDAGYPKSQAIACDSTAAVDGIEETVTAGSSSLSYDAKSDQYIYVWKTDKAWAGACRQLVVRLNDLSYHRANFKFTK